MENKIESKELKRIKDLFIFDKYRKIYFILLTSIFLLTDLIYYLWISIGYMHNITLLILLILKVVVFAILAIMAFKKARVGLGIINVLYIIYFVLGFIEDDFLPIIFKNFFVHNAFFLLAFIAAYFLLRNPYPTGEVGSNEYYKYVNENNYYKNEKLAFKYKVADALDKGNSNDLAILLGYEVEDNDRQSVTDNKPASPNKQLKTSQEKDIKSKKEVIIEQPKINQSPNQQLKTSQEKDIEPKKEVVIEKTQINHFEQETQEKTFIDKLYDEFLAELNKYNLSKTQNGVFEKYSYNNIVIIKIFKDLEKNNIKVLFALNPSLYDKSVYHQLDVSNKKGHETTPLMYIIKKDADITNAITLLKDVVSIKII